MSNSAPLMHVDMEMSLTDLADRYAGLGLDYNPIVVMVADVDPATMTLFIQQHLEYQALLEHPLASPLIIVGDSAAQPRMQLSIEHAMEREGDRLRDLMVRSMKRELLPEKPHNERGWYRKFEKRRLR